MQVVELASVIFTLLMEVLIGIILTQLLKATSREKTAWLGFYRFVAARKLYYLVEPMYLRVLTLAERSKDTDKKIRD